jgi:3-dehydroquinate dehydratase-2
MAKILIINGPNLNLLGTREPEQYGQQTLDSIMLHAQAYAQSKGHTLEAFQSNAEHELINRIHQAKNDSTDFIIINPAAFTHTSIALRDALLGVGIPFIEVHLSNVHKRETYRHQSYFSDIAQGVIVGFGALGYELAVSAVSDLLNH